MSEESSEFQMCTSARGGDSMRIIYEAFMSSLNRWHTNLYSKQTKHTYQFNERMKETKKQLRHKKRRRKRENVYSKRASERVRE